MQGDSGGPFFSNPDPASSGEEVRPAIDLY
jgi:hypothetical protein